MLDDTEEDTQEIISLKRSYLTHLILDDLPQAEEVMRRIIALLGLKYGPEHESLLPTVELLAGLLWSLDRKEEAEEWLRRVLTIRGRIIETVFLPISLTSHEQNGKHGGCLEKQRAH